MPASEKPNFIVINIDDMGYADISEKVFGAKDTSHGKLNDDLGVAGDPATTELFEFVDRALKP